MNLTIQGIRNSAVSILLSLALPAVAIAADSAQVAPVVTTQSGSLQGFSNRGSDIFLGIPYAKPPVDALRWQPPLSADPWQGIRLATEFGPACMQFGNFYTSNDPDTFGQPYGSEDCLYLNIWKPSTAKKRPVLVFIHGGSAVHGAASLPLYNGQRLARELGAVFVSINYRLAFFGNIQLAALRNGDPATDSGYFAALDQIQALEWVQENIEQFGGDANNVTVMGHSAGCASVWSLMRSPLASGTFNKVICLSGIPLKNSAEDQRDTAHRWLANLLKNDGEIATDDELEAYLNKHTDDSIQRYLHSKSAIEISAAGQRIPMVPGVVDGYVLTTAADEAVVNPVPTMMGQTLNEAPILMLHAFGSRSYGGLWDLIHCDCDFRQRDLFDSWFSYAKFKATGWGLNKLLLNLVNDSADLLVEKNGVPVYRYNFTWDNLPEPWLSTVGVYHGLDVAFLFGNFGIGTKNFTHFTWSKSSPEERESIHTQLAASVRGFLETDDPNYYKTGAIWSNWGESHSMLIIDRK